MAGFLQQEPDFSYLGKKIMEINTAIFKPDTDTMILPNNIITTSAFDKTGHIWFYTSCQKGVNLELVKEIYATLDYFNKERHTRIRIYGTAFLLNEAEAPDAFKEGFNTPSITERQISLVRLSIEKAECFNIGMDADDPWLTKLKASLQTWLYSSENKKLTFDVKSK